MEVTAHVTLEEGTDNNSGRNRACMKAIAYLTEAEAGFGPQTELVDVTARKGKRGSRPNEEYGYFKVEVTYVPKYGHLPRMETEHIKYPNS